MQSKATLVLPESCVCNQQPSNEMNFLGPGISSFYTNLSILQVMHFNVISFFLVAMTRLNYHTTSTLTKTFLKPRISKGD